MLDHDHPITSRRAFLGALGLMGAAAALDPKRLIAGTGTARPLRRSEDGPVQQIRRAAATDPVKVQALRGNVRMLAGSGGNVTAAVGREGVVLIESGIVGRKVTDAVATFSRAPVTHVINTHWHFDHTEANDWHRGRGAEIIASARTRERMSVTTRVDDWDFTFPASPASALPSVQLTADRSLRLDGTAIEVALVPPAHTDTDLVVHLPDADVLVLGDVYWNGIYPFIDYSTGGGIDGTIRAAEGALAKATAETIIVPGHGAVGRRTQLARYVDTLVAIRERVASLKGRGMTLAEVVAARPTAPYDAGLRGGPIGPEFFTRLVYAGV